jgi:hypothetical protein
LAFWGAAAFVFHGCVSTRPMALTVETKAIETKTGAIALMTLKMSNQYVPSYQPGVRWIQVNPSGQASGPRFVPRDIYQSVKNEYNEYLVSVQLAPGKYSVGDVLGYSGRFPVAGNFCFPMDAEFQLKPEAVVYIGHVDMVNRRRRNDTERRSGSIFPLVDQGVTGFAGGTFDISISDRFDEDMKAFRGKYPVIADQQVEKALLVKAGTAPVQAESKEPPLPQ